MLLVDNKSARREQNCSANSYPHPGDIYYPDFLDGRPAFFDVTVRNSLQPVCISAAAFTAGAAAAAGEVDKDQKHDRNVAVWCSVFSIVVESLGYWTPASLKTLKTIAFKTTTFTGIGIVKLSRTFYLSNFGNTMLS